jgi:fibronectin type 3 domain-containing protein
MKSLTDEVYYKITAVDYNNNPSAYSEVLVLKRPDIIAPAAPVIRRYNVENSKVTIEWINSSSRDVVKHHLLKTTVDGRKEVIAVASTSYTDSLVEEGREYRYAIAAIDDAGLQTLSSPLNITVAESSIKPGVDRLTGSWQDKKAVLQWESAIKGDYELVVFKATDEGELVAYKKIEGNKTSFEDKLPAGKCRYAIKVLYRNGAESELSQPVVIEANKTAQ